MVTTRRYDLDWLRVIAFGLLIFYHIGMFYVTWGWHVKSVYVGSILEPSMMLLNPWRLSLLFFISGVALRYYYEKGNTALAAFKRFLKLFIPLVFGMYVIVVPQSYFQLLASGEITSGYWAFYKSYIVWKEGFSIFTPTWNHLWYVAYLIPYSLIAALLIVPLRVLAGGMDRPWFAKAFGGGRLFLFPAALFVLIRFTLDVKFEETHDLTHDWAAHARYGSYFLIGYLIAKNNLFWSLISDGWRKAGFIVVILAIILSVLWSNWNWVQENSVIVALARAGRVIYAWMVIMVLLGVVQSYLNKPSQWLSYLTTAVFPYYILHQTLIIVFGVWLSSFSLGGALEFTLLLMLTTAGCVLGYEYVIRPLVWLRPFFGVFGKAPHMKMGHRK